jgi:hypothetical protein
MKQCFTEFSKTLYARPPFWLAAIHAHTDGQLYLNSLPSFMTGRGGTLDLRERERS